MIIPVYNDALYLRGALESVVNQTLRNIEIICIDDHSADESRKILEEYEEKDSRIKIILHKENQSSSQARKDGVSISKGRYVMFLDGDDEFDPHACEEAYSAIEEYKTDIVQFDTEIINCSDLSDNSIRSFEERLRPYTKRINEENITNLCFVEHRFSFTLWNKIYRGDLCRRAFGLVEDGSFPKAQDMYAFFIISSLSRSYIGIDKKLYRYFAGRGDYGKSKMDMTAFSHLLTEKRVCDAIKRFAVSCDDPQALKAAADSIEHYFLGHDVGAWKQNISAEYDMEAFSLLVQTWGIEAVCSMLAEKYWFERADIARRMLNSQCFNLEARPVKTVAIYYRKIQDGGAEKVTAQLSNILEGVKDEKGRKKYKVILITDDVSSENEYYLEPSIIREYLPECSEFIKEKYQKRLFVWSKILDKYDIDAVVSGQWMDAFTLWDMLAVKGHRSHPGFVLHIHSFTMRPYQWKSEAALEIMYLYQLCDGAVVLSDCDRTFVELFCGNTHTIANPVKYIEETDVSNSREKNSIVWSGRLVPVKQPEHLIFMMERVVREIPDAKLYIVGTGEEEYVETLKKAVSDSKLDDNIVFTGFTNDVSLYYKKAQIAVCTSMYEGFPMFISEALSYELPVIMYDLPWLMISDKNEGICPVEMGRYDLLAREVIRLLENHEERNRRGKKGQEKIREISGTDIGREWGKVFDGIGSPNIYLKDSEKGQKERILFEHLTLYQAQAKQELYSKLKQTYAEKSEINAKLKQTYAEKSEINAKLQLTYKEKAERGVKIKELEKELSELKSSRRYKFGRALTAPARKLKRILRS